MRGRKKLGEGYVLSFVVSNLTDVPIDKKFLQKLSQKIWQVLKLSKGTKISLVFVDKKRIKELNQKWRGKNQVTDILSFNYQLGQKQFIIPQNTDNLLGELVICLNQVKQQAHQHRRSWQVELTEILIHGILHLLGYKHETKADRNRMETKAKDIKEQIN